MSYSALQYQSSHLSAQELEIVFYLRNSEYGSSRNHIFRTILLFLEENSQLQQHVITLCGSAFCFYHDKDLQLSMKRCYKELKYVWTLLLCEELEMQTGSWISLTWHKTKATAFAMRVSVQIYSGLPVSRRWSCNFQ